MTDTASVSDLRLYGSGFTHLDAVRFDARVVDRTNGMDIGQACRLEIQLAQLGGLPAARR